MSYKLKKLQ